MSEWVVHGISNCDTVKKARRWFDAAGIAYRFHDFRKDGLSLAMVRRWLDRVPGATLLNRSSTSWRKLDDAQRQRADDDLAGLLVDHPTLIKRPVIEYESGVMVGFGADTRAALEGMATQSQGRGVNADAG